MNRSRRILSIVPLVLFGIAMLWLYRELEGDLYGQVVRSLESISWIRIGQAFGFTALSFLALTGYDWLGARYAGIGLPYRRVAPASAVAHAFENTIGRGFLTSSPLRVRLYGIWGVSAEGIAKLIGFCAVTSWVGFLSLGAITFTLFPDRLPLSLQEDWLPLRVLGATMLGILGCYLLAAAVRRFEPGFRSWPIQFPSARLAGGQVVVSTADWMAATAVLLVLLPSDSRPSYAGLVGAFLVAQLLGALSGIPGGLGVFEVAMVVLAGPEVGEGALFGALVLYRLIYFLAPLFLATLILAGIELHRRRARVGKVVGAATALSAAVVPHAMAFAVFLVGALLLFTGAVPPPETRLSRLGGILPLGVIEASHFLASVAGGLLLVLARGLQRRLDGAYQATLVLLGGGIVLALLRGLDWAPALILALIFAALAPLHDAFDRKAALYEARFTPGWIVAVALVLVTTAWLTFFSFRNVALSEELWWTFALRGDASRTIRALVAVSALLLVVGAVRLLRPAPPEPDPPTREELDRAQEIASRSSRAHACLALLGDKRLLFSEVGDAYLMYAVEGRSWISLGDPVGPEEQARRLVWRFREMAERHDDWPVFYQVADDRLTHYVEAGLSLSKIGEEGRVPLEGFSLEGGKRKELRQVVRRTEERENGRFEILPRERVPELMPRLREISDAWLADKRVAEKGFSLGFFEPSYLGRFPLATVWIGDRLVAFANVLAVGPRVELSLDLMRYVPDAPPGIMTYLFVRLMIWGAEDGYERFSLGMAPLAGLDEVSAGTLWNRLGALVYRHGEHFYNFKGLRAYKDKFAPVWEPRYLASPGGLALPKVLTNLAALISGGVTRVFRR